MKMSKTTQVDALAMAVNEARAFAARETARAEEAERQRDYLLRRNTVLNTRVAEAEGRATGWQQRAESAEARIATLTERADTQRAWAEDYKAQRDDALARAEQAERTLENSRWETRRAMEERDEWERLWKKASMGVLDLQERVTQLAPSTTTNAEPDVTLTGEPAPRKSDTPDSAETAQKQAGEPAEDRCPNPACGSRVREDNLVGVHDTPDGNDVIQEFCEDPWHTTPKEDPA